MRVGIGVRGLAARLLQSVEQILFHYIQVLKHCAFRLGGVVLFDRSENLFMPTARQLVAPSPDGFYFVIAEQFPEKRQAEKKRSPRFIDLYQSRIVYRLGQGVMKHSVGIAEGAIAR